MKKILVALVALALLACPAAASDMYMIGGNNFHKGTSTTNCTKTAMTGGYDNLEMWDCTLGTGFQALLVAYWPFPELATNSWDVQVCFQTTDTSSCKAAFNASLTAFPDGSDADAVSDVPQVIEETSASVHTVGTEYCTDSISGSGSIAVYNALTSAACTGTTQCDHARVRLVTAYNSGDGATCDDIQLTSARIKYIAP